MMRTAFLFLLLCACKSKTGPAPDKSRVTVLNARAMTLYARYRNERDSVLRAISLLNEAIALDSTSYLLYADRAAMFCSLGRYDEAIQSTDRAIAVRPAAIEVNTMKGFLQEKAGRTAEAHATFEKSRADYDSQIQAHPEDVASRINRAFLFFFTGDSVQAVNEFMKVRNTYPDQAAVKSAEANFFSFNRTNFLRDLCTIR